MNSSNGFDLRNPKYARSKSMQLDAGSDVIFCAGSQIVFDYRVDASKHGCLPLHENTGLRVGGSGCKLSDQTKFLKRTDKKIDTGLHYREL